MFLLIIKFQKLIYNQKNWQFVKIFYALMSTVYNGLFYYALGAQNSPYVFYF